MIISLKELNKFLPKYKLDLSIEKDINNLGYEVESITNFSNVSGIKFAKILKVEKNPNSKLLNIVTVETKDGILTIQTIAQNPKAEYFTVVFAPGSKMGDITINEKEMGGVISQGMLSGYNEFGYNQEYLPFSTDDVILLDDKNISIHTDPMEYFDLNDYLIDITVPANRPDANSYYVLARELAAYYKTEFKWFDYSKNNETSALKSKIKVKKHDAKELTFIESKLKDKTTSLHDVFFLAKHNIAAKNNYAIDLTNMALILTGAPAHVYDRNKIKNNLTCELYSGQVEILGNKTVEVNNVLAIKDDEKVISLASVMGCEQTQVESSSDNVVFEIGVFDSTKIRHCAKEIKIDSASSIQGGKGINSYIAWNGISYIKYRLLKDKQLSSSIINLPKIKKGTPVIQNRKKLAVYANCDIKHLKQFDDVEAVLKELGFVITKNRIIVPSYRTDIEKYEDIIEEYFRFYGYDKFQPIMPLLKPFKVNHQSNNKNWLKAMGYNEIRTFTLISEELNKLNPFNFKNNVKLQTFVSKEREVIRNSIITSMLESAKYNIKRKMLNINFFESGMINNNNFVYGLVSNTKTFDEMKQDIANFLYTLDLKFIPFTDNEYVHPYVSAKIYHKDNFIGWIGKVYPTISDLNLWVAEFVNTNENNLIQFDSYDPNPLKTLDLTFEINEKETIEDKIKQIKEITELFSISQIDEYKHDDKRNVTLRLIGTDKAIELINNKFNKK